MCEYKRKTGNRRGQKTRTKLQNLLEKAEALGTQKTRLKVQVMGFSGLLRGVGF